MAIPFKVALQCSHDISAIALAVRKVVAGIQQRSFPDLYTRVQLPSMDDIGTDLQSQQSNTFKVTSLVFPLVDLLNTTRKDLEWNLSF